MAPVGTIVSTSPNAAPRSGQAQAAAEGRLLQRCLICEVASLRTSLWTSLAEQTDAGGDFGWAGAAAALVGG